MRAVTLLSATLLVACTAGDLGPTGLPALEADAARTALRRGNTVLTIVGDPRDYVGSAMVDVTIADAPRIVLLLVGLTGSGPGGLLSLGGEFVIDEEVAATLSTTGWDFDYVPEDRLNAPALTGQAMHARLDHMEMHADPDGLFFATLHMIETETGEARTVTAAGRLTGGCAGAEAPIPDLHAVPLCEQVLGSF